MNPVDAGVVCLVALGAALGARRGLLAQAARLLALAGGLYAARGVAMPLAAPVRWWFPSLGPPLDRYAAFLGVFGVAAVAVAFAAGWAGERIRRSPLAPLDRLGGAAVGAAKGLLLVYVGLFVVLCFPGRPLGRELISSRTAPALLRLVGVPAPLFPSELEARAKDTERTIAMAREAELRGPPGAAAEAMPCATGARAP